MLLLIEEEGITINDIKQLLRKGLNATYTVILDIGVHFTSRSSVEMTGDELS